VATWSDLLRHEMDLRRRTPIWPLASYGIRRKVSWLRIVVDFPFPMDAIYQDLHIVSNRSCFVYDTICSLVVVGFPSVRFRSLVRILGPLGQALLARHLVNPRLQRCLRCYQEFRRPMVYGYALLFLALTRSMVVVKIPDDARPWLVGSLLLLRLRLFIWWWVRRMILIIKLHTKIF